MYQARYGTKKSDLLGHILNEPQNWRSSNGELYSYERDPNFVIQIGASQDYLSDRFKKFPDTSHDVAVPVEVQYNNAILFYWNFMYLDGYRILIPVPKTQSNESEEHYDYFDLCSTEIKVFEIIGQANLNGESNKIEGLKNVACFLKIELTNL